MTMWNPKSLANTGTSGRIMLTLLCLLAFLALQRSAHAEITAIVIDGTLKITGDPPNVDQGTFSPDQITLSGGLAEDITLSGTLQKSFARAGITAIDIVAPQDNVTFLAFEFDGDIGVNLATGGRCELLGLNLKGDIAFSAPTGRIVVSYRSGIIDGNVVFKGGPGTDSFGRSVFGGFLAVSGNINIDTGPGDDVVELINAFVGGDTLVSLGVGPGWDVCTLSNSQLNGNVMISGDEGDDDVIILSSSISGDLFIETGSGADLVLFHNLLLTDDAMVFLNGGNGNSDRLELFGFPLLPEEFTGFEIFNP